MNNKKWYKVKVYFANFVHYDSIKGHDEENAIVNAYYNWNEAEFIELV